MIPLAKTDIGPGEAVAVNRVLASGRIALGDEMVQFEKELATYVGVNGAVMTNSGTSGLMIVLEALGIGAGDEVIIPALTFVGTANAVLATGAIPVLADVEPNTANLSPESVSAVITSRTRALIPVHLFGLAAPMTELLALAEDHGIAVIEDACEAIGGSHEGRSLGGLGRAGVFGFYPNKLLTTGEGGMVVSDDMELMKSCRALVNQGRDGTGIGYSMRGTEIGAAIGRVQLESLDSRIVQRNSLAHAYAEALSDVPRISIPWPQSPCRSWFTFPVLLEQDIDRDQVMARLAEAGVASADYFTVLTRVEGLNRCLSSPNSVGTSEQLSDRLLCLPFWVGLDGQLPFIAAALEDALNGSLKTLQGDG